MTIKLFPLLPLPLPLPHPPIPPEAPSSVPLPINLLLFHVPRVFSFLLAHTLDLLLHVFRLYIYIILRSPFLFFLFMYISCVSSLYSRFFSIVFSLYIYIKIWPPVFLVAYIILMTLVIHISLRATHAHTRKMLYLRLRCSLAHQPISMIPSPLCLLDQAQMSLNPYSKPISVCAKR